MSNFPDMLRELRVGQRLSQSHLARKTGFDHSYLSRLEAGSRVPSRGAVLAIARGMSFAEGSQERDDLLQAAGYSSTNEPRYSYAVLRGIQAELDSATVETRRDTVSALHLVYDALQTRRSDAQAEATRW